MGRPILGMAPWILSQEPEVNFKSKCAISFGKRDVYATITNRYRIGVQVVVTWPCQGFPGAYVEPAIVFWTFDAVIHDKPVTQMNLLMRA